MRILLINIPHPSIGSLIPDDHLPPLGLLSIGGPLLDDGHEVSLLDAAFGPMPIEGIIAEAVARTPDIVMFSYFGSTSGHPVIEEVAYRLSQRLPVVTIVYGGVYPTYHWREILLREPYVSAVVRGEGEETTRQLVAALESGRSLFELSGIAFRRDGVPVAMAPAPVIRDRDAYRMGWELIEHVRPSYWGGLRAMVA